MVAQLGDFAPDMEQTFDYHRRTLQVMQHGLPEKRWLLKTPGHLMTLELLFATYPDAWLVQTHRDPSRTMPSTASITAMVQWMRTDHVDLPLLCSTIESIFSFAQNHVVELRASGALPQRFVDVHFRSMMSDPVVTLREAYATMGRELDPGHAEAITAYLRDKPQGKFGKHRYSPEEWGYDAETLRKNLRPYIEYFGIELES
jgi:hypothetical protein